MPRLLRITTVPISLHLLLQGQFRYMREYGFEVIAISADGEEVTEVIKDGTHHIVIPFTRKITPFQDLICLWKLVLEIKRFRPDIVHTHTPKAGLLGMIAARICRVPVRLHTVAGLPLMETNGIKRYILEIAEKVTYSCAQVIYPNSEGLKKFLQLRLHVSDKILKVIGKGSSNGIDTVYFSRTPVLENKACELRAKYNVQKEDLVFSFTGRIVGSKGIAELATAFREVSRLYTERRLFLMLIGPFEQDLDPLPEEIIEFLKGSDKVVLTGFQEDVRPWIMASDVFVFPSYREGFPNVVMQASLLEVPCIVSDINGCNEIVEHNKTGLVVPPKNVTALVESMKELVNDESKRKQFAAAARDFVAANFKREVIWEELRKEYLRMLGIGK